MENKYLKDYYDNYDEENRLLSQHGKVEFLTTLRYIDKYLKEDMKILEIGAGTGRYSLHYADKGFKVEAVELMPHNISVFQSKIKDDMTVNVHQGNACNLSMYEDNMFDMTLVLGPMYHLFTEEDKKAAISEALRVTKKGGLIYAAFTMNDSTIFNWGFMKGNILDAMKEKVVSEDFQCASNPDQIFEMWTMEDIKKLFSQYSVEKLHMIATDGLTNYRRDMVDEWSEEMFNAWLKYHFTVCEREDLIGYSDHTLFIGRKK
ncbi:Methyltransferase domain-containing protein [Hathewaya proteolytica DSM 3090]|uniref:Methyltransferase domain-containing protein n=1 Tax=Hathewaya proteolytica DSM 3090 TaxID=1121331 RepID=A0A1M6QC34_9CLOT|nr:class I SAM-dependent methyltransferase [Hathewaya proteolytica]SHK17690.1 Methyltransferase domain-containing protein [Hathewaya proteolytica DSM 3090]